MYSVNVYSKEEYNEWRAYSWENDKDMTAEDALMAYISNGWEGDDEQLIKTVSFITDNNEVPVWIISYYIPSNAVDYHGNKAVLTAVSRSSRIIRTFHKKDFYPESLYKENN